MKKYFVILIYALLVTGTVTAGEPYKVGDKASDFTLKNVKGEMISLSGINEARGFIVVFTCNTCPMAKKYEQRIIDLDKEFSPRGYPVIAINSNDEGVSPGDSYDEMKKLAKSKGYSFEYLYDESQDVAKAYGATNTPHAYVLSKRNGSLIIEYTGAIDNNAADGSKADKNYIKDAVSALLQNNEVPVTSTKAIGCSIKWKNN